ncbi:MAG: AMP-binding protein [Actinomycetes bacterium]
MRPNVIAQALARAAEADPGRVAVRDRARAFTFAEVAERVATTAGALVDALDALGAQDRPPLPGPTGPVVPVLVRRDAWAPSDILAVHHAGLAVAPFDATLPTEVLRDLWRRAGSPPLVLAPDDLDVEEALPGVGVVRRASGSPQAPRPVAGDALATVLFTSGTTGAPKGVMFDWDLVAQALERWDDPTLSGPPGATVGLVFPFHFWGGYQRILGMVGGRSISVADPTVEEPTEILRRFADEEVDVTGFVPSMIPVLASAARASGRRLDRVRTVLLGGEAVTWHHVGLVRAFTHPEVTMSNGYGGSESPVGSLRFMIPPQTPIGTGPVPVGEPVAEGRIRLEPIDDSAVRQVVVCGPVATGYLGEPELTEHAFATLPDGTRCWWTGDVVAHDPDGALLHVGRIDDLTKISGKIVAPAQTQTVLLTLPGVREVAVLAQPVAGRTRLVAHIVVDDTVTDPSALRAALRARLPAHQLPHVVVRHERLPTTSTTKVDRRALLDHPLVPWRTVAATPPSDHVTHLVVVCAAEVIGVHLGVDDDLWDFGLDSLGAVELAAALADAGWNVDPSILLEHPTPAAIAERLATEAPPRTSPAVDLNPTGLRPVLWCLPGGGAPAIVYRSLAAALGPEQPLVVVEPRGYRTPGRPRLRVPSAARDVRAVMAERTLTPPAGVVVLGHSAGVTVAYETARLLADEGFAPHLIALDSGPRATHLTRTALPWSGRARRAARRALDAVPVWWRWAVPRSPERVGFDERFLTMARWAGRRYRPPAPTFPVTLVQVPDSTALDEWPGPFSGEQFTVLGEHLSMLHPPHVDRVAEIVAAVLERTTATSEAGSHRSG